MNPRLSVCVPAYNEERTLAQAVEDLERTVLPAVSALEIIVVDDGSTDSTPRVADGLLRNRPAGRVRVVHHPRNLGIGAAYRSALAAATGDYFTWFPADHENTADEFLLCLPHLACDVVVTCNHLGLDRRSSFRRGLSRLYTRLLNLALGLDLKYYNGLSLYPLSVLRGLRLYSAGFLFAAEGLVKARRAGCRVVELTAPLSLRGGGKSKAVSLRSLLRMAADLTRILLRRTGPANAAG